MVTCELCGETTTSVSLTRIAGTAMKVCSKCKNMGKDLEPEKNQQHTFRPKFRHEDIKLEVVNNYSSLINNAIHTRKIDVHILARSTNIRESTLTKYITNKIKPDVESARKIEKFLDIKLIEEFKNESYETKIEEDVKPRTLGDMFEKLQKQIKK